MSTMSSMNNTLTSPMTDRDDPVLGDDVIFYTLHITTAIIFIASLIGIIGNIVNIIVFTKLGAKDTVNINLCSLAVSDLLVSLTSLAMALGMNPGLGTFDLPFNLHDVINTFVVWPRVALYKMTKTVTAFLAFERCLCVAMPLKVKLYITAPRVKAFVSTSFVLIFLSHAPIFYSHPFGWKFNRELNRSIFSLLYKQEAAEIKRVFFFIHSPIFSPIMFIFICACTVILFVNLRKKAAWRLKMKTASSSIGESNNNKNQAMTQKDTKVAKMVTMVCVVFIIFGIPDLLMVIGITSFDGFSMHGKYRDIFLFVMTLNGLGAVLNSATNIIIYYLNSSNYKDMFTSVFSCSKSKR